MFDLSSYAPLTIFFIALASILSAGEIGWQLGTRLKDGTSSNVSTLESAMLGLLALMLAFTFSMALARFEARRDALLNEANAIGTTVLRARLFPDPPQIRGSKTVAGVRPNPPRHYPEGHFIGREQAHY